MSLDLGEYKEKYSCIFKIQHENILEDEFIKFYSALKGEEKIILKSINKEHLKDEEDYDFHIEQIKKEIKLNYICNSDYIIKMNQNFETEKNIVYELEYYDLDLKQYLLEKGKLETKLVGVDNLKIFKDIAKNIASSVKYIHQKGVVHRNIKPHNIFIQLNTDYKTIKDAKIGDFSCAINKNEISDSEPMGTILYTAPEIIKNLDYTEKCDMWSVGLTLFELYFGVLPYDSDANTKKMNDMIYDEKKFVLRKSDIPTLDILFKKLLQINPEKRMDSSEFYDYVNNEDFLKSDAITINNKEEYLALYQEIINSPQIEYKFNKKPEKLNKDEQEKENIQKILGVVEEGNLPDIMNFANGIIQDEEKFNNIIYYDTNVDNYKNDVYGDSNLFEQITPGAFILCNNIDSLEIIKDEILRHRKSEKKVIFNLISNGQGYINDLKKYLANNKQFKKCLNKCCIYCRYPNNYMNEKKENPDFISLITCNTDEVINFIKDSSSKDIKPFPLTKLITFKIYSEKYKERHKKISEFYGDLNKETYEKNMEEIKKVINDDEEKKILKFKKENILKGLLKFNLEEDLKALDELIIKEYTRNTYYGDLNRWLMKGKMKYYEPVAYFTSRLMYSLNKYATEKNKFCKENEKILYRGAKLYYSCLLPYERAVGKIILLSAFTSSSENEDVAATWAGRGRENEIYKNSLKFSVVFYITNLYNENDNWISNSIDVQNTAECKIEKEFLFQPFSFYKVTKVEFKLKEHKANIYLETVGKKEILEEQIKNGKKIEYNKSKNIMEAIDSIY